MLVRKLVSLAFVSAFGAAPGCGDGGEPPRRDAGRLDAPAPLDAAEGELFGPLGQPALIHGNLVGGEGEREPQVVASALLQNAADEFGDRVEKVRRLAVNARQPEGRVSPHPDHAIARKLHNRGSHIAPAKVQRDKLPCLPACGPAHVGRVHRD